MTQLARLGFAFLHALCTPSLTLAAENLALRQQILVLRRQHPRRPFLRRGDRIFWAWLARLWSGWREVLVIVKPETVIGWQRAGFRLYWRWKSRAKDGRPCVPPEVQRLIREMSGANRTWGAPRIHHELAKLGINLTRSSVARYMIRPDLRSRRPGGQSWRTFLRNHLRETVAVDFFTVSTASFRVLYVFVVLSLSRRKLLHFNVVRNPSAQWAAQQVREAFPWETMPRFLQRDRDGIFGNEFQRAMEAFNIEELVSSSRSPWQNGYAERVIGSIRRDCLDHVIVLGEHHLREILKEYVAYYNASRTHLGLDGDCPEPREVGPAEAGRVIALPVLGGLHHRYRRRAA